MLLVGGPGQGKTTLGQLIAQAYRVGLLADSDKVAPTVRTVADGLRARLEAVGVEMPRSRRWPMRVGLAAYADDIAGGRQLSLWRWIADTVSRRGSVDVSAAQLRTWLQGWPWVLILDGLDEVPAQHTRDLVLERVDDLLLDAHNDDADLVVVATTRPQGYDDEFAPDRYHRLTLLPLTSEQATAYASAIAVARNPDDPDEQATLTERMAQAARAPLTARLMTTPLQVTIMSLLLGRQPNPPQSRHGLFEAYYQTIYARESGNQDISPSC